MLLSDFKPRRVRGLVPLVVVWDKQSTSEVQLNLQFQSNDKPISASKQQSEELATSQKHSRSIAVVQFGGFTLEIALNGVTIGNV